MSQLNYIVKERLCALNYVKNVLEGNMFLYNTVLLDQKALNAHFDTPKMHKKANLLFNLGMCIGAATCIEDPEECIRRLSLIIQEHEKRSDSKLSMKSLFALKSNPQNSSSQISMVAKAKRPADSENYYMSYCIPFQLDYKECLMRLCDTLDDFYENFSINIAKESHTLSESLCANFNNFDAHIEGLLKDAVKDLSEFSTSTLQSEFDNRSHLTQSQTD